MAGPTAGLDVLEKREISCKCRNRITTPSVVQPVAWSLYWLSYLGSHQMHKKENTASHATFHVDYWNKIHPKTHNRRPIGMNVLYLCSLRSAHICHANRIHYTWTRYQVTASELLTLTPWVRISVEAKFFLFSEISRPALGPTQPSI
jgi:hypothetical protein